jgi:hypothetical protein
MTEVPALKELNNIREFTGHDLSVLDRDTFMDVSNTLTLGRYSQEDLNNAYDQLHLIVELGGSHDPIANLKAVTDKDGKNTGKYDIEWTYPDQAVTDLDDARSRLKTADAMLSNTQMLPVQTNSGFLADTNSALLEFIHKESLDRLAKSGVRDKPGRNTARWNELLVQNFNDISGGYDRYSRDYIANQPREFGHYVPHELGGSDDASNGRMQARGANRATGARLGIEGAKSALGPTYQKYIERMAGDILLENGYNIKNKK